MKNLTEIEELERMEYSDRELEELQRRRELDPNGIHYIRIPCIYKRLGLPDPIGEECPDCRTHGN